jgi:hypothetical protein
VGLWVSKVDGMNSISTNPAGFFFINLSILFAFLSTLSKIHTAHLSIYVKYSGARSKKMNSRHAATLILTICIHSSVELMVVSPLAITN